MTKKPNIRFKGFDQEWEEKPLDEMGDTYTGLSGKNKNDFGHGDGRYITYMNVFTNPVASPDDVGQIEIDNSQNQVKKGDILFTTSSETPDEVGMSSVWLEDKPNIYLNSFCFGYRPSVEIDPYFSAFLMRSPKIRENFYRLAQGISRFNISKQKAMEMGVQIPDPAEQSKIGEFFKALDELIGAKEEELEKLRQLKAALLEQMFPSSESDNPNRGGYNCLNNNYLDKFDMVISSAPNTPRIRFKGFSGPWERKTLKDVVSCSLDYGLNVAATKFDGKRKYLRITDIDDNMHTFNYDDLSSPDQDDISMNYKLSNGDLCFARTGASVGKTYLYNEKDGDVYFAGFLIRARISKDYFPYFVFLNTQTENYAKFIKVTSQRTGQPGVNSQEYESYSFDMPTNFVEQQKIGEFFREQDEVINASTDNVKKLKIIKQALLEKMFAA